MDFTTSQIFFIGVRCDQVRVKDLKNNDAVHNAFSRASNMIKGILIINNHGKPRLVKFYQSVVRAS